MLRVAAFVCRRRCVSSLTRLYSEATEYAPRAEGARPRLSSEPFRSKAYLMGSINKFMQETQSSDLVSPRAYQLVKACGSGLVHESPQSRVSIAQSLWKKLQKKYQVSGFDVGLYNTLLQVYLLNEHAFSPSEFLEEMKAAEVSPNQGTLSLLLQAYCQQGNIAGATTILEHMKALEFPVNEHIYAALVTGHARSGDMTSAGQLLGVMRERDIEPGLISYTALLRAHAEKGDIEAIRQVLSEMKGYRLFPNLSTYLKVLDSLSRAGHGQHISEVLEMIRNKQWILSDIHDLACQFSIRGEFESALTLTQCLADMNAPDNYVGAVIVRAMTHHGCSVEEQLDMVHQLWALGYRHQTHEAVLYKTFLEGEPNSIITVLRDMHTHDVTIKSHYLFPVFAHYANSKNLDALLESLGVMQEFGLKLPGLGMHYILKAAGEGGIEAVVETVKEKGLLDNLANTLIAYMCEYGHFEGVANLLTSVNPEHLGFGLILKSIDNGIQNSTGKFDIRTLARVYTIFNSLDPPPDISHSVPRSVSHLCAQSRYEDARNLLDQLHSSGVPMTREAYTPLLDAYNTPASSKVFFALLRTMTSRGIELGPREHAQLLKLSSYVGDYEKATTSFNALKEFYPEISVSLYNRYVIVCVKAKRTTQAIELIKEMCSKGKIPSSEVLSFTIETLLRMGHLEQAIEVRENMLSSGYDGGDFKIYNAMIEAFAKRGDVSRAQEEFDKMLAAGKKPSWYTFTQLMSAYVVHGAVEPVRQLMEDAKKYDITVEKPMVSQLITAYINSGDLDGAVAAVKEFPDHPPIITAVVSLANLLVERGEEQKATDMMRELGYSDSLSWEVLLFANLKAGSLDRAREILQKEVQVEYSAKAFAGFSRACVTSGQGSRLRDGIAVLLEAGPPSDELCVVMLRAYGYVLKDTDGAVAFKDKLESMGKTLPERFHLVLAAILKQHHHKPSPKPGQPRPDSTQPSTSTA